MLNAQDRRQEILATLSVRRHEKLENFATEFQVSRRTIERDILTLSLSHPIYTTQGNGGGVHYMDGCFAGRKYLTDEQDALLNKLLSTLTGEDMLTMQSILKTFSVSKKTRR